MNYQLVLQIRAVSFVDCAAMITLKNALIEEIGDSAEVDGHAYGSCKTNFFIFTSDPAATFSRVRPVLGQHLQTATVAYRKIDGEHFTVIWPEGSRAEFSLL